MLGAEPFDVGTDHKFVSLMLLWPEVVPSKELRGGGCHGAIRVRHRVSVWCLQAFLVVIELVLATIGLDWPVQDGEEEDVQIQNSVG